MSRRATEFRNRPGNLRPSAIRAAVAGALLLGLLLFLLVGIGQRDRPLRVGVDLTTGFYTPSAATDFGRLIGRRVSIVQGFVSWEYPTDPSLSGFPGYHVTQILQQGAEPEITWDPSIAGDPPDQPQLSLAEIADGRFDSYIRAFAGAAKAVHRQILIRFAHEMNGDWTSYYVANSGNRPGDFVRAWRHVVELFRKVGADNVQWVWAPNATGSGGSSLASLYPGNRYVDWVGLDGYSYAKAGCQSASQIFDPALAQIARFSDRPEMLSEVGVSADCPAKASLVKGLFKWLGTHPRIRAIIWWQRDEDGEDWDINSTAGSLDAFKSGLRVR